MVRTVMSKSRQSLPLQIVTFLERVHKTKFCNVVTISHGCNVITGLMFLNNLKMSQRNVPNSVARKETHKHQKHLIMLEPLKTLLCYKNIPVRKNLTEILMVNNNGKTNFFLFFIFFLHGLIDWGGLKGILWWLMERWCFFFQKAFHMTCQAEDICFSISYEQNFIMKIFIKWGLSVKER